MLGCAEAMRRTLATAATACCDHVTRLLKGETGVGPGTPTRAADILLSSGSALADSLAEGLLWDG